MKTTELRIGNLMQEHYTGKIITVIELTEKLITFSDSFIGKWQAEPIKISEEILLKCGFEPIYKSEFTVKLELITDPIFEAVRSIENDWHIRYKLNVLKHVKYLHQLQNLYFALCGQELNTSGL